MLSDTTVAATPLSPHERRLLENYPWLVVLMVILFTVPRAHAYVGEVGGWDWLLLSGVSVFIVAYPLSLLLPGQVVGTLRQLKDRGVLPSNEAVREFEERLHSSANRWAGVWGWILAGVLVSMWLAAFWDVRYYQTWQFTVYNILVGLVLEIPLAIGAGRYVGRVLCYGRLVPRLRRDGILLRPIPDHPDGAAGIASIGRLYVGSALLIIVIAAFLSVWVLLIPHVFTQYGTWRGPYAVVLVLVVVCEALAIALPLRGVRAVLADHRQGEPIRVVGDGVRWVLIVLNVLLLTPVLLFLLERTNGQ